MPSAARKAFDANLADIEQLIDYHNTAEAILKETQQDLPAGADVLLRAAIVLLITYWEAYLEDIVSEALEHLLTHTQDPNSLPTELKKAVAREIKTHNHELSPWMLAGPAWRQTIKSRLPKLQESRNRSFNTPKSMQTKDFICAALGIADITKAWNVDSNSPETNRQKLDKLVEIRGRIAHRGKLPKPVTLAVVKAATQFVRKLVAKTGGAINSELKKVTGKGLWE